MKKRRIKLIDRRLQLKLTLVFAVTSILAMCVQALFLSSRLEDAAKLLPLDGEALQVQIPGLIGSILVISLAVFLPVVLLVGVNVTFRVAGPLYRIRKHLESIERGEPVRPCKIREGDHLQSLCTLINEVTDPLRIEPETASQRDAA